MKMEIFIYGIVITASRGKISNTRKDKQISNQVFKKFQRRLIRWGKVARILYLPLQSIVFSRSKNKV